MFCNLLVKYHNDITCKRVNQRRFPLTIVSKVFSRQFIFVFIKFQESEQLENRPRMSEVK